MFDKDKALPCKLYEGGRNARGYGSQHDPVRNKTTGAHRIAYERHYGVTLTSDEFVCHHCDNRPCIEPTHLFLGSNDDNMRDMIAKGRQSKGEKHANATNTDADVALARSLYTGRRGEQIALAKQFNVSKGTMNKWLRNTVRSG